MKDETTTMRGRRLLRVLTIALPFLTAPHVWAVDIYPGTNIQSVVNANPPGTTYTLHSGIFRLQTITPHQGDVYQGVSGTVLSGAIQLTSFTQQGSYWLATGQTQQGVVNTSVPCESGYDACQYPEELFFDSVRLQRVASLSEVASGKWYFDYGIQTIYFYDNPNGHTVETSVIPHAFIGGGGGVTIQNLTVEKYATPSQDGAISSQAGWRIQNSEIRLNHGTAIRLDNNVDVLSSYIHDNGQMGLGAGGTGNLVDGNEIAYNNGAHFDYTGSNGEAGGTKFSETTSLVVSNNYVHDNIGPGIWLDYDNVGWTVESNRTANNQEAGILDEISYNGTIEYNILQQEGAGAGQSFWYGSGIQVSASPNAEIFGNTLVNCLNGIGAIANQRGSGPQGPFVVQNLYVHDNMIVEPSGYAAGMVADAADLDAYTSLDNRFTHNTYDLGSSAIYEWYAGGSNYVDMSASQWIAAGEDTTGTWLSSSAGVPSTQFAAGAQVSLISATAVMSLPTTSSSVVSNLSAGVQGTVTKVAGPIYSGGTTWWQVLWNGGFRGWAPAPSISSGAQSSSSSSVLSGTQSNPWIGISYPYNDTTVSGTVSVTAVTTDTVPITQVQFFVDGSLVATNTAAPWGFLWNTAPLASGSHVLIALAYDADGNKAGASITLTKK